MYDILIIGAGPAGVSAALTARSRGRSVLVISNPLEANPLSRAPLVDNYPGMEDVSGRRMLEVMHRQLQSAGIPVAWQRAAQAVALDDHFACAAGSDVYEGRALILAVGQAPRASIPGEQALLGRGVSYCATCDGMLYRGRTAAVLGLGVEAPGDANFLASIGCRVLYFAKGERRADLRPEIDFQPAVQYVIHGADRVTGLEADGYLHPADAVFILRNGLAADCLLPGLRTESGHIAAAADGATSIPGVFAAGDCAGKPHQAAKAAGEGNVAALSADRYLTGKI